MIIKVNPHTIDFTQDVEFNSGEYNITTLEFEFSNEFNGLTNQAVFSTCNGTYKTPILNNQCVVPYEVLEEPGQVLLGVFGYEGEEELTLRYSPTPKYFNVKNGSYKKGNEPQIPPKSEWEQLVEEVNEAITETNNLNIEAEKEDNKTTITITHKDGEEQTVEILDGEKGDKGDKGDPGAIHMIVVQTLPTENIDESAIYLVPLENPTEEGNNYAEYVYINNQWELLGKIGVQVDLTDYVKNTDYATASKGGVIKSGYYGLQVDSSNGKAYCDTYTYANYGNVENQRFISKGTLENVITGKSLETSTNKVTTISSSSTDTQYPSAKCVYDIVGNLESILETLDIGSGV